MPTIDFYFDFVSPYSYLANCRLPALAQERGCTIAYKPIDLKATKLAAGNTGPATAQMPLKLRYAVADLTRWAKRYGAPIAFSTAGVPDPTRPNKGTYYAIDRGQEAEYVRAMWHATFGTGGAMGSEDVLRQVATGMGWNADDFIAFVDSEEAARRYEEGNLKAQERGVFGVPIMMVGDAMWWGNDRLDFLEEHLAAQAGG